MCSTKKVLLSKNFKTIKKNFKKFAQKTLEMPGKDLCGRRLRELSTECYENIPKQNNQRNASKHLTVHCDLTHKKIILGKVKITKSLLYSTSHN